jgi:hypothetical protein
MANGDYYEHRDSFNKISGDIQAKVIEKCKNTEGVNQN